MEKTKEKTEKKKRGVLPVELGEYKDQWVRFCKRNNEKPGPAIRGIIVTLLAKSGETEAPGAALEKAGNPDRTRLRTEIRLTRSERDKLEQMAEAEGLTVNQYLVNLARTHIVKKPQFSIKELDVLSESNVQLLALGRNLNQIARALNAEDPDEHRPTVKEIKGVSERIYQHTHLVSNLINANLERWLIK